MLQLTLLHAALLITVQARRASHIRQSRVPRQHRQGNRGVPVMRWRMWTRTSSTQLCMWTAPRLARYALLCTFLCQRDSSNGRERCKFRLRLAPSTCKVPAAACPQLQVYDWEAHHKQNQELAKQKKEQVDYRVYARVLLYVTVAHNSASGNKSGMMRS